jgi:tRNA 2-thiouridine synthesizing protein A
MQEEDALDLRGLKGPLPALLAQKALGRAAPGTVLTVLADDPLAAVDIPHMCHTHGHSLDGSVQAEGYRIFTVRRGPAAALPADSPPATGAG